MKKLIIIMIMIIGTSFGCASYTCPTYASTDEICVDENCKENKIVRTAPSKLDLLLGYGTLVFVIIFAANAKQ